MKKPVLLILFSLMLMFVPACRNLAASPPLTPTNTPEPTSTASPVPTSSPTPEPTATDFPTETPSPSPTATKNPTVTQTATEAELLLPLPEGEPLTEWKGIPIMPGAIAGKENDGTYDFTIDAPIAQIEGFYESELAKSGWMFLGGGQGENGNVLNIFTKGEQIITLSLIQQNGVILVLLLISD